MSFQLRSLAVAVATLSAVPVAYSAGLDRSGQSSTAFTEKGTLAYINYVYIDPDVSGKDTSGNTVNDFGEDYSFINFGAKTDINDSVSVGVYFDQPWGAKIKHSGESNFVSGNSLDNNISGLTGGKFKTAGELNGAINAATIGRDTATATQLTTASRTAIGMTSITSADAGEVTNVDVKSQNMTGLIGLNLGQNKNFHIYGGPAFQKVEGEVHLRGSTYQTSTGYDLILNPSSDVGWVAGVGFSKPEIGLKASLTYRSEIDHDIEMSETLPILKVLGSASADQTQKAKVTTPESYNLDFQTGLNPTTLLTAKVRYVPWSDFKIVPPLYNQASKRTVPAGLPLIKYSDDSWSGEIGIGKRLSPKLAVSGSVGYDTGAGNPATTLGPIKGYWNFGLGAKYNITPEWSISGGAKYVKFGDAQGALPNDTIVGDFEDNKGMIYGLSLAYHKK